MQKKVMILDRCTIHLTEKAIELYATTNTITQIIPGGCTKYLQPLDSVIINSFKRKAEAHRLTELTNLANVRTNSGNIKPMIRQTLINIISKSWKEVQTKVIIKGFKLTGTHGVSDPSFIRHQLPLKQKLEKF